MNQREPTVWIVNEGGHDFSAAAKWGRMVPLTAGAVNHFNVDRLAYNLAERLRLADPDDYLLVSGSPLLNVIAFQLWLRKFERVKILQFSQASGDYVERVLTSANLDNIVKIAGRPA